MATTKIEMRGGESILVKTPVEMFTPGMSYYDNYQPRSRAAVEQLAYVASQSGGAGDPGWWRYQLSAGREFAEGAVPAEVLMHAPAALAAVRRAVGDYYDDLMYTTSLSAGVSTARLVGWCLHEVGLSALADQCYLDDHSYAGGLSAARVREVLGVLRLREPELVVAGLERGADVLVEYSVSASSPSLGGRVDVQGRALRLADLRVVEAVMGALGEPGPRDYCGGSVAARYRRLPGGERRRARDESLARDALARALPAWRRDVACALDALVMGDSWIWKRRPGEAWDQEGVLVDREPLDDRTGRRFPGAHPVGLLACQKVRGEEARAREIRSSLAMGCDRPSSLYSDASPEVLARVVELGDPGPRV